VQIFASTVLKEKKSVLEEKKGHTAGSDKVA